MGDYQWFTSGFFLLVVIPSLSHAEVGEDVGEGDVGGDGVACDGAEGMDGSAEVLAE